MKDNIPGFLFLVYLTSAFIMYYGTSYFPEKYCPSKFYGMIDGKHPHLQRTVGLFLAFMALLNGMTCIIQLKIVMQITFVINTFFLLHYCIETFYYQALSVHFMSLIFIMVGLNTFWSLWSHFNVHKKIE